MKLTTFLHPTHWFFPESRRYRLEVFSTQSEILKIKDFAQAVCGAAGYSVADANIVKLVLEEVCVNIVRHAYAGLAVGKIQLEFSIGTFVLRMKILDQGKPFDFKSIKAPNLKFYVDVGKKGGLGIWFIRKMTHQVRYRTYSDHNEWTLFYRPSGHSPPKQLKNNPFNSSSFLFILSSFILFSFLIFLIYVLSCLMVVHGATGESVIRRIWTGFPTSLGRGIALVYGLGLVGFYLIFLKLFKSFREEQGERIAAVQQRREETARVQQARGEYERLLGRMSEMEKQLHEAENKLANQAQLQVELRLTENARQDELRSFENTRKQEAQAIENARVQAALEVEKVRTQAQKAQQIAREEMDHLSQLKNDLELRLQEAQLKIEDQAQAGLRKEVELAQQIQRALLPEEIPQLEGFQVGVSYRAAKAVGGDYYDFIPVDAHRLGIAVGEVSHKGVPGSMVISLIRTATRLEARHRKSPANVLLKVQQHVHRDMKGGMFATMFYIIFDSRNHFIRCASAGHPPMILYRKLTDEVYFVKPKGFPLGMDLPDESLFAKTLAVQSLSLQKKDVLMIYNDGVTKAMNPANEPFGKERLIQTLRENADDTPEELVKKLEAKISDFTAGAAQKDDVTIVVIKEDLKTREMTYRFRKNLLDLVKNEDLSIAAACRKMKVSPQTYFRYKALYDQKGYPGLRPVRAPKRRVVKELSVAQKKAVLLAVQLNPEWEPPRLAHYLKKNIKSHIRADARLIAEYLSLKGLGEARERKIFAATRLTPFEGIGIMAR